MNYKLYLLSTINNKLSKLEFSSSPSSNFRWSSEPSFDNNQFAVDLTVMGNSITEITNNTELLYSIIKRAKYEYDENGSSTVELRLLITDSNNTVVEIGHLEVIGGSISGQMIGDEWILNKQKDIRLTLFTTGDFRRYASKIYNTPEGSQALTSTIASRVGYKWVDNMLYNSHFNRGTLPGDSYFLGGATVTIDWDTAWNTYGTNVSIANVLGEKTEKAMVPPYCLKIDTTGLGNAETRGFHQICSGVTTGAGQMMGAVWYTWDEGTDTGVDLCLELNSGGTTYQNKVTLSNADVNSHPLSNGYKLMTLLFSGAVTGGAVDYRVFAQGKQANPDDFNVYIGGCLLTGMNKNDADANYAQFVHPQDFVASGIYNQTPEDYDYWMPYVSSTYIKNREDGLSYTTTSGIKIKDFNDVVVWGVPGDMAADAAVGVYYNKDELAETDVEEIFIGKQTFTDYYDQRPSLAWRNTAATVGTNWTNGLTGDDLQISGHTYARLDSDGATDGLYSVTTTLTTDVPFKVWKNMTWRALIRCTASDTTTNGITQIRLGYTSTPRNTVKITYNPPADLTVFQNIIGGEASSGQPQDWVLVDGGLVKFDIGNITEYATAEGLIGQNLTLYVDVDATNNTRFYLDDIYLIPAEEFFYSYRGKNGITGDWDILYGREKAYSRFNFGINPRLTVANQDYDGSLLSWTPWLPNRLVYFQNRKTTLAANLIAYSSANKDSDKSLWGVTAGASDLVDGTGSSTKKIGDAGANVRWQAQTWIPTVGGVIDQFIVSFGPNTGSPSGTVTYTINADGTTAPGTQLCTGTFTPVASSDNTVTVSNGAVLTPGTKYWIVLKPTSVQSAGVFWTVNGSASSDYANGSLFTSSDSGASWASVNSDLRITLRTAVVERRWAASFTGITATELRFQVYMKKILSPTNTLTISIQPDSAGSPSGTAITNGAKTYDPAMLGSAYGLTDFDFQDISVSSGTTYWLVIEMSGTVNGENYVQLGADASTPPGGNGTLKLYKSSWTDGAANLIWNVRAPSGVHTLEDRMKVWVGFNPKGKFLLTRKPDPSP